MAARIIWILIWTLPFWGGQRPAAAADYRQVAGLIDIRTTHSDGDFSIETVAAVAKKRGFDAVFITDHDRLAMEYGLFPLRNILRRHEELDGVNRSGAAAYLRAIREAGKKYPDVILIPGSESVPYYYWTGSYFKDTLTAHDHEKRILSIGLERPEDYENLPVLHNGLSTRYVTRFIPQIIVFFLSFLIGLFLIREKGFLKFSGIALIVFSLLFMINTNPFRSSPYDPYMGGQGIAPYQLYIDYVGNAGGMTFWNYPETQSGVRKYGPIFLKTPPYPQVLEEATGYTGFAAIYGDNITVTEPGHEWDRVLEAYCRRKRSRPVWGISTADFHTDSGAGGKLGNFPTVFLVKKKTKADVLTAMKRGRMYAVRGRYPQRLILDEFSIGPTGGGKRVTMGGEIVLPGPPKIRIRLSSRLPSKKKVTVRLIRSGRRIRTVSGTLPMTLDYEDAALEKGRKNFYRLDVHRSAIGSLVSNPIFVSRR